MLVCRLSNTVKASSIAPEKFPTSLDRISKKITEVAFERLLGLENDAMHTQGTSGENVIEQIIHEDDMSGIDACRLQDVAVKSQVRLTFPHSARGEYLVKNRAICEFCANDLAIAYRDVRHRENMQAVVFGFELADQRDELVVYLE